MNVKHLTPFVDALVKVLNDHGIDNLKRGKLLKKDVMNVDLDVTSVVGIGGESEAILHIRYLPKHAGIFLCQWVWLILQIRSEAKY